MQNTPTSIKRLNAVTRQADGQTDTCLSWRISEAESQQQLTAASNQEAANQMQKHFVPSLAESGCCQS